MIDDTGYIIEHLTKELTTLPKQRNRCIQHLTELGYIPVYKVNILLPLEEDHAKTEFLKDAKASGLFPMSVFEQFLEDDEDLITEMLGRAVDIDEGFVFDRLPESGEQNLITRIIHYRLDLFGVWEWQVSKPFNAITVARLKEIADYAECDPLEAANLLADIEYFTQKLLKANSEDRFILTFRPANTINQNLTQNLDNRHKFKKQLIEDFGDKNDFFKYLRKNILKENPQKIDMLFLQKEALNPFKRFILRLIQVHQWQEGLYDGLLDSDMGEVTINSIVNTINLYNVSERKNIKRNQVLTYIANGYFLFNALFFLQEYMVEDHQSDTSEDAESRIISDIMDSAKSADQHKLDAFQEHLNLIKSEITAASTRKPEEKKGLLKRIYFGIKRFFKKVVRFSKKIFNWIVELSKKIWRILKKVFGHFFNQLAKGIKAFIDGIKYLFGKKNTVTAKGNNILHTSIRFDGDAFVLASRNASSLINEHIKKIRYHTTSMIFSLLIVGGVFNIVLKAINVISWPLIIFSIIKIYKNISESYQNIEFITT